MTKSGKRLYQVTDKLMHCFAWLSAGVVGFNFVLLTANVVMRYVFSSPIMGTPEIVAMMMTWVAYSGMAYTLLNGKHMQLEASYEKLQGRAKNILSLFVYLLATVLFILLAKASFDVFWASWLIKEESVASVTVYVFIGKCGAFVGWVLLSIQALLMTIYCFLAVIHPDKYEPLDAYSELLDEESVKDFVSEEAMAAAAGELPEAETTVKEEKGGDDK